MRYLVLVAALLAGAAGYTAYWFYVAGQVEMGLADWADQRRAEGLEVAYQPVSVRGFPFRLLIEVGEPTIGRPDGAGAWHWRGQSVEAVVQPWNLRHLIFSFDGRHELSYVARGERRMAWAQAETQLASVVLDGSGHVQRFAVDLQGLEVMDSAWSEPLQATRLQLHGRINTGEDESRPAGSRELTLDARGVALPAEASGPLGAAIAELRAEVTLMGSLPPGPPRPAIAAWRDDGGTVELGALSLIWGPLDIEASGTLALDADMRPIGAATARVKGYAQAIDALLAGGWIASGEARAAKTLLGLLAKEEDGDKVLHIPLSAQGGRLYVGPLPLLRLPPLLPPASKNSG